MLYDDKYKAIKERTFNAYMIKSIKNVYLRYLENEKEKIASLNEVTDGGDELIDLLVGDTDVTLYEEVVPKKLEKIFSNKLLHDIVESLTYKEKLAIFLYHVSDKTVSEMAEIIGFKSSDSVKRISDRTIEKIRTKFFENGGFKND